ncbi:MAG: pseudaminic acid cytidylyltransferase [Arcobacteraceae bacterium]|jgi:pseudaminic acid cytidylyltransferase
MAKNIIAIIPARGGSKRIPKKNIKDFFGKPLIAYSIEVALASKLFEKVIVTTDDEEIAAIAKQYGAEVPFMRPKELSDDFTGTTDVVNHAVDYLEKFGESYEYICTIYATAPLLQTKYLLEGYEALKNSDAVNAFSSTSMPFPIQRTFKLNEDGRCEMFTPEHYMTRSQDLEEAYQDAGQFYWTNRIRQKQSENSVIFSDISIPIILPRHLVQDIDTLEDWDRAEYMYQSLNQDTYDKWNSIKKLIDNKNETLYFRERDIYFLSVGQNIGRESYGKKELFLRPVLVYKKLSHTSFLGIPLTSKVREGTYYFSFNYIKDKISTAMFNNMRVFDIKRADYKSGVIKLSDFKKLIVKLDEFMNLTLSKREIVHASQGKLQKSNQIITEDNNYVK